jgi:hypothetical protein
VVKLEYVPSKEKITYIFTKPLPRDSFEYLKRSWESFPLLIKAHNLHDRLEAAKNTCLASRGAMQEIEQQEIQHSDRGSHS